MKIHERRSLLPCLALLLLVAASLPALAGPREQAKRIHDRLVGVPPDATTLDAMVALVATGQPLAAADLAMQDPAFYRTALKNFVTPWTNVERTVFAPLNDYSATVIGMIRDDVPFDEVLTADLVYVGAPGAVSSAYSHSDNQHYEQLEDDRVDLSDPNLFEGRAQSTLPGSQLTSADAAGVLTTRAAGEAFFSAGTNRRMWRFTGINFLCRDMEELKDVSRPADRIRQDISRSPGGDSQLFHQQCVGCHSGMDPMAQAFAYFEWDASQERVVHTPGFVQPKYLINSNTFPGGYITVDNRWDNFWRVGSNAALGWRVAASRAFSLCQVQKVFEHVCFRPPQTPADAAEITRIADVFETESYSMKRVFAEVAVSCMGN
jgi:hypothetical protein